ncbi:hypothetical protein [Paenibacillus sp. S28]|uniref:hypothetical protein n=1 Tax=Paenibacillus sp. S28 TaxID=2767463 RepID=UPI00190DE949|nr:hypothetical protein [Paenibacillus sp. S28]MBJ9993497.1 hypothetical protein [Paenibacillus sp. S28]
MRTACALMILFVLALGGCSSSEKEDEKKFTVEDLGIVSKADGRKVYYGMKQADAEAVLGQGKQRANGVFEYGLGIEAAYGEGKLVYLRVGEEAKDHYKTALNAEIGMTKDEFESIYGNVHMPTSPDAPLTYVFNMKKRMFLENNAPKNDKAAQNLLLFHAMEYDGIVDTIAIIDSYSTSHSIKE